MCLRCVHGLAFEHVFNCFMVCCKLLFCCSQGRVFCHIEAFRRLGILMQSEIVLLKHVFTQFVFVLVSCWQGQFPLTTWQLHNFPRAIILFREPSMELFYTRMYTRHDFAYVLSHFHMCVHLFLWLSVHVRASVCMGSHLNMCSTDSWSAASSWFIMTRGVSFVR